MIRKILLALTAAGTLAMGIGTATSPASADIVLRFGNGYHHHGFYKPGFYRHHYARCFIRTVRVRYHHHWVWRNVRVCPGYNYGY